MKKQLILAAISAALIAAPFADAAAASSFSSGPSKSSSSTSSSKSSSSASKPASTSGGSSSTSSAKRDSGSSWGSSSATPKRDTSSGWGSTSAAPAPKRDYGASSWGSPAPSRKAEPVRPAVVDYAPANRVTPQPKPVSGFNSAPAAAITQPKQVSGFNAAPAPAAVQPTNGFSDTKSSTKKKLATVAGATALGGALYAAGANHEAVAAYERSQEPAVKPAEPTPAAERTAAVTPKAESRTSSHASVPSTTYPTQQQPQVIIVKEAPRYRDHDDDAYWYQRGRETAAREARRETSAETYGGQVASAPVVVKQTQRTPQVVQPSAPSVKKESSMGSVILWTLVILLVLGALAYFVMQVMNAGSPKASARPAARKSNYTL